MHHPTLRRFVLGYQPIGRTANRTCSPARAGFRDQRGLSRAEVTLQIHLMAARRQARRHPSPKPQGSSRIIKKHASGCRSTSWQWSQHTAQSVALRPGPGLRECHCERSGHGNCMRMNSRCSRFKRSPLCASSPAMAQSTPPCPALPCQIATRAGHGALPNAHQRGGALQNDGAAALCAERSQAATRSCCTSLEVEPSSRAASPGCGVSTHPAMLQSVPAAIRFAHRHRSPGAARDGARQASHREHHAPSRLGPCPDLRR